MRHLGSANQNYVECVLRNFSAPGLPVGTDELDAFLLYQRLYESTAPLFYLSDLDPTRRDGYEALLWRWTYDIWRHRSGPKLVKALRRSARRFARRGLDYVVIVGLLYQIALSLMAPREEGYAVQPAGKTD